jgi:hypothetical protein
MFASHGHHICRFHKESTKIIILSDIFQIVGKKGSSPIALWTIAGANL